MTRSACVLALTLALLTTAPALAVGPDYTYLELRYIDRDVGLLLDLGGSNGAADLEGSDGKGYALVGSLLVLRNIYVVGEYTEDIEVDLSNAFGGQNSLPDSLKTRYTRLGVGLRYTLVPGLDVFAEAGWERNELDLSADVDVTLTNGVTVSFSGLDEDSVDFKLGLRALVGERLDLTGYARQTEAQLREIRFDADGNVELSDDTVFGASAAYYLSQHIALGAHYESGDLNTAGAFLRLSF